GDFEDARDGMLGYYSAADDKHIGFYDAQLADMVKVPRLDRDETLTGQWTIGSTTTAQAPFLVSAMCQDELVTGLNADSIDGWHGSQSADLNTVAVRYTGGRLKVGTPVDAEDAVTKAYADALGTGLSVHDPVKCAAPANIPDLSNVSVSQDGYTCSEGDRILLPNQTDQTENGVYVFGPIVAGYGALTRSTAEDSTSELDKGTYVMVENGDTYEKYSFVQQTDNPVIDTDAIVWKNFYQAAVTKAGNGLGETGTTFFVKIANSSTYGQWGLVYADSTTSLNQIAAGSAGQILRSGGAAAPAWSTATFPTNATAGDILYASDNNVWTQRNVGSNGAVLQVISGLPNWHTLALASTDFANQGTATTVLHGNAAGNPSWGQIVNADMADAAAVAWSKLAGVSAASKLIGRGSASGAGALQEITLGDGLSMTGTTLGLAAIPLASIADSETGLQLLQSGGAASDPAWSNLTMPAGIAAGSIFVANTLDTLSALTSTSGTKYLQNAAGTISWVAAGSGNGIDADTVDGVHAGGLTTHKYPYYSTATNNHLADSPIFTDGTKVGILTTTPGAPFDIASGNLAAAILIGADQAATTRTNVTNKYGAIALYHYTNAEEPMSLIGGWSTTAYQAVAIGGGFGSANAATEIDFYTAADKTTLSGTIRWTILNTGILQSAGAQTIQTSTGNLTLATAAGNGNILLTPNGTGKVGIMSSSPGQYFEVNCETTSFGYGAKFGYTGTNRGLYLGQVATTLYPFIGFNAVYYSTSQWKSKETWGGGIYGYGDGIHFVYDIGLTVDVAYTPTSQMVLTPVGQLQVPTTGSTAGILIGGDTQLYRSAANVLRTPDNLIVDASIGVGVASATAILHLKAGTATASTAPLKFTSGTLLGTPEAGAIEFLTDAYYATITTGAARKTFAFLESPTFTGHIQAPHAHLTDTSNQLMLGTTNIGTLTWSPTTARTITLPDATGTVAISASAPITLSAAGDIGHSTANGYKHVPSDGASAQLLQYSSAGTAKWISLSADATIADGGAITIAAEAVTFAKMAHIATARLLGRGTATTGDVEAIALSSDWGLTFGFSAGALKIETPQDLRTGAGPTFDHIHLGATGFAATDGVSTVSAWNAMGSGFIGTTSAHPLGIMVGGSSIATWDTSGFLTIPALTASSLVGTDAANKLVSVTDIPSGVTIGSMSIARIVNVQLTGTGPTWTVTHNLNNWTPLVLLRNSTTGLLGVTQFKPTSANAVEIKFNAATTDGQFYATIIG
ncbi:MAG: hypothetical protein M1608_13795, partial [Candidatus Omnitrophica bacterium]|nr:hypothetical protein [Candidatus Omnitrophota bacterium]